MHIYDLDSEYPKLSRNLIRKRIFITRRAFVGRARRYEDEKCRQRSAEMIFFFFFFKPRFKLVIKLNSKTDEFSNSFVYCCSLKYSWFGSAANHVARMYNERRRECEWKRAFELHSLLPAYSSCFLQFQLFFALVRRASSILLRFELLYASQFRMIRINIAINDHRASFRWFICIPALARHIRWKCSMSSAKLRNNNAIQSASNENWSMILWDAQTRKREMEGKSIIWNLLMRAISIDSAADRTAARASHNQMLLRYL